MDATNFFLKKKEIIIFGSGLDFQLILKIAKGSFTNAEHKAIIMNHSVTQDGFAVLYDLAARCHPHLLARTSRYNNYNARPQMMPEDNIYSLKRKYENWLEIEKIDNHVYTDECLLRFIMQDLRDDTRYDKALRTLEVELSTYDTMKRHSPNYIPFPTDLMLHNIPQTVMACYTDDEKDTLFVSPTVSKVSDTVSTASSISMEQGFVRTVFSAGTTDDIQAFIKVMKGTANRVPARESIDEYCQGCGKYGHDVFHQGCDFCAQLSIALKFLDKNPNEAKKLIREYMSHQRKRKDARKTNKQKNQSRKSPSKKTAIKATLKALQSALNQLSNDDSSQESKSFVDASEDIMMSESSSDESASQE